MSLLKLAWKNIVANPLRLLLNLLLFALGIGLIQFMINFNNQLKNKFDNNLADIDMVLGAKGSALQLILCNMYHIDNPTGNINLAAAKPFLNPKHPLIKEVIPISSGDSYKGFRIIGTERKIIPFYNGELKEGRLWEYPYEVVVGSNVAKKTGLNLNDSFFSSHGFMEDEDFKHDHAAFKVVGILQQSGTVLDQLVLCSTKAVWDVHDHDEEAEPEITEQEEVNAHDKMDPSHDDNPHHGHDHDDIAHDHSDHDGHSGEDHHDDHEGHNHDDHDHAGHDHHGHDHEHHHPEDQITEQNERALLLENPDKDITAILVRFKNKKSFQALSMPRQIKENTELMAASPAYEISKLFDMIGVGTKALRMLAYLIGFVSFISIFISLLNALKNRKYELALIRVMGASPGKLFMLILLEGVILAILGFLVGIFISFLGSALLAGKMSETYQYNFDPFYFNSTTLWLLLGALSIGILAAVIPAFMAYKTNIHQTLSNQNS